LVFSKKPQISAPLKGIPKKLNKINPGTEILRNLNEEALSPVQWKVYFPDPGKVLRESMNSSSFLRLFYAEYV
jgi:hypothetical protein